MLADHIIKFPSDHPMMAPHIKALRFSGNCSTSKCELNQEILLKGFKSLRDFVGQIPKIIKAKKSVAGFKLRKGSDLLLLVTIRDRYLLNSLLNKLIFTSLTHNLKSSLLNNHIQFGLINAGLNINIYLKGNVTSFRGNYYKSTLLLP